MTRRRLWGLTALVCLLLVLPGLLREHAGLVPALDLARWQPLLEDAGRRLHPDPRHAAPALALGATLLLGGLVALRRSPRPRAAVALALVRRGRAVPEVARRARLAQDAVRDLARANPVAVSTGRWGTIFRRKRAAASAEAESFAAALDRSSFDANV